MKLSLTERIVLLNTLPETGNFITLKIIRKLREALSLDEAEIKSTNFRQEGDRVLWDMDPYKDIEIGEKAADVIAESLKKLDREGKLTQNHIDLYEKFVTNNT